MNHRDLLSAASRRWGIRLARLRPDLALAGSPERTAWRSVVETDDGRLFVLEKIPTRVYGRKKRITETLQRLVGHGLKQTVAYLADFDAEAISLIHQGAWHGLWQLSAYVAGVDLRRPAYAMDGWRGEAAAAFLIQLDAIGNRYPVLVLAIRFAWLSEWLRKNDRPMLGLEADYMALLVKSRAALIHPEISD